MLEGDLLGLGLTDGGGGGVGVVDDHGLGGGVPGDIRPQQLAQGGQRQVGGAVVDEGGDHLAGGVPDGVGGAVDLQGHVRAEGGGDILRLAGGRGSHDHAAGQSQGGGDVGFLHRCFLSFMFVGVLFAILTVQCGGEEFYCGEGKIFLKKFFPALRPPSPVPRKIRENLFSSLPSRPTPGAP